METNKAIIMFGENLTKLRAQKGLTQKEMAVRLGIGIKSLRKLERGMLPSRLRCDVFDRLFDEFGITADKIFQEI